ncbi:hypothetical protein [Leucobacter sp. M11]|uniref:hypothetical protein n=1 Tax=Leucobacter sp. M11 TaxID=2993565 RepID=UPI002D80A4EC|nr:hypothetical protein [Leucobacter sp. M11]MEB4616334.1 hypothetical protein [Leucobacter sp. M11]
MEQQSETSPHLLAPKARRARRRLLITLILAVAALLIGGAITVADVNASRTPQATAEKYFAALAAGDATAANALTAPAPGTPGEAGLLTDEVLGNAIEHISAVSVTPADTPLDSANQNLEVTYTLADHTVTVSVYLVEGPRQWGLLRTWQLARPVAERVLFQSNRPLPQDAPLLSGVPLQSPNQTLFPAVYPLASGSPHTLALEQDTAVVTGVDSTVTLEFTPTDALRAEAQTQINAMVDACAASTLTSTTLSRDTRDGCPLHVILAESGPAPGTWEILDYPTVQFEAGGSVYLTRDGRAQFHPEDGRDAAEMLRGLEFAGTVEINGDRVRLIPQGTQ